MILRRRVCIVVNADKLETCPRLLPHHERRRRHRRCIWKQYNFVRKLYALVLRLSIERTAHLDYNYGGVLRYRRGYREVLLHCIIVPLFMEEMVCV